MAKPPARRQLNVAELFAGVGGFRVGLERVSADFITTFSSQWEPPGTAGKQFASRCYVEHFGPDGHSNEDIAHVLERVARGDARLPKIDIVVGGFPCQDYSVAKPANQATGLIGKKGVLWWQIHRLLALLKQARRPAEWLFLENVDRLLKSPTAQRGRDFALMLASLDQLGYDVEWRVVNAADYGFPQRRRRVFLVGRKRGNRPTKTSGAKVVFETGVLARALPLQGAESLELTESPSFTLHGELDEITRSFGRGVERTQFGSAGFMREGEVWTFNPKPAFTGKRRTLGDVVLREDRVDTSFTIADRAIRKWKYVKGAKAEQRVHKASGFVYHYTEGALPFPDPLDRPSRTILTSEGGSSASRSKHIVSLPGGGYRRLLPVELERLNGFPDDWTATGMSDIQRAFCMGNALVIGIVELIGARIAEDAKLSLKGHSAVRARAG